MRRINIIVMIGLFLMASTVMLVPNVTYAAPQTAEQKQAKKNKKNLESLKQGIDKIQKLLDEKNAKKAKNAVKSAERNYTRLSAGTQGTEEVVALKATLDALAEKVKEQLDGEKQAKKDDRSIASIEKYLAKIQPYLNEDNIPSARRSVNDATRIFAKISEVGQQQENVVALRTRLDQLTKVVEESEIADQERKELLNAMIMQRSQYGSFIESHRVSTSWLHMLNHGKNEDSGNYSLSELAELREIFASLAAKQSEFNEKFKLLIEQEPGYVQNGFAVTDIIDLFENRVKYRDALVELVCQNYLDSNLKRMENTYSSLESDGCIPAFWLEDLYGPKAKEPFDAVQDVLPHYKWIAKAAPQEKLDAIAAYKPKLRKLLETKAKSNKWNKSKYAYNSDPIKKEAKLIAERKNMDLKKVAMTSKDEWHINKNELGVPLSRTGSGFALFQKDGEPFKRGYEITFTGDFNGVGYEPISRARLTSYVWPYK